MISLLLAVALGSLHSTPLSDESWVALALQSNSARQVLASFERKFPNIQPTGEDPAANRTSAEALRLSESLRTVRKANATAGLLIRKGRTLDAYNLITDAVRSRPELEVLTTTLIPSELLTRHYWEAYRDVVIKIGVDGANSEDKYLMLSMASAEEGETYPGQSRFCLMCIHQAVGSRHLQAFARSMFEGSGPSYVALLSSLALGLSGGVASNLFLEDVLRTDPTNGLAARAVVEFYEDKRRYSEVRRVAGEVASHLPFGEMRDYFTEKEREAALLKDAPIDDREEARGP